MTRRDRGISAYAKIFGVPEVHVAAAFAERVGPVFAEEALQTAGGPAWSDPALTDRERGIAIITALAALAALGVTGDRLATHVRLARQNGLDRDAMTALMTCWLPTSASPAPHSPWKPSTTSTCRHVCLDVVAATLEPK